MPSTGEQAAAYQRLQAHLAYLKLPTTAEVLPEVLEAACTEYLTPTALLERLLDAEVRAIEQRRLTGQLRFARLPAPWTLEALDYGGVGPRSATDRGPALRSHRG